MVDTGMKKSSVAECNYEPLVKRGLFEERSLSYEVHENVFISSPMTHI